MQGIASLAQFGRFEDNRIAHVADGEMVVPAAVLESNPLVKGALFVHMRRMGVDPERYIVGSGRNSINPVTGQPEFFLGGLFGGGKGKGGKGGGGMLGGILGAIAGSFIPGMGALGPAIGAFAGTKLTGGSTQSALLGAGIAGLGSYLLGNSGAAQAGGYGGGLGLGGKSLGSSLFSGVSSGGIGSLFTGASAGQGAAAPASMGIAANAPASPVPQGATGAAGSVTQAAAPQSSAPLVQGAAAAMPKQAAGENSLGLMDWAKKNPLMTMGLLGGGMYLLNQMEGKPPPNAAEQYWNGPDGAQRLAMNPQKYGFNPKNFMAAGGHVAGPGGPKDDRVPAMLSDGEFVMTADAVRGMGMGDRMKGAQRMYAMMKQLEGQS